MGFDMKEKIIRLLKDKYLYVFFIITLVFFGVFIRINYTTDTYAVIGMDHSLIIKNFFQSGRYITGLLFKIIFALNIGIVKTYLLSYFFAVIFATLSQYKLFSIIKQEITFKNRIKGIDFVLILITVLMIINPFSIELFFYIEKGIIVLSVLFSILAFEKTLEYLKLDLNTDKSKNVTKKKRQLVLMAILYMLGAMLCYQGTVGIFIVLSAIYIIKYSKKFKDFIKYTLVSCFIYGIPALLNVLSIKILFKGSRVSGEIVILESIKKVFFGSERLFHTFEILPKYTFIVFLSLIILLTIVLIIRNKNKLLNIVRLLYILIITYFIAIIPQLLQSTNNIWLVPRSTYTFACLFALIGLYIVNFFEKDLIEDNKRKRKYLITTLIGISALLVFVELYSFYKIEIQNYQVSFMDQQIALKVKENIEKYESETNKTITKISIYGDKNRNWSYAGIHVIGDMNISALSTSWSDSYMINYYIGRNLVLTDNDSEIKQYFESIDYSAFSEGEIIIKEDTLHFCTF